jgi:signal transduction histidine kinase/DNA-binding response OmpR family regulator
MTRLDRDVIHVFTPVMDNGKTWGYFHLGLSLDRLQGELRRIRAYALFTILALAVLSLFGLQWLLELMIARPMARLSEATRVLAGGGYPEPLAARSRDEIGALVEQFNGLVVELQNVSLVKQELLERMEQSTQDAIAASRLKSEFLANMSHEIRTPLNGVLGMTSLLLDTELDDQQKDFADTVRASAESLLGVINDILDFSKIEAGKLAFEDVDFDLVSSVETAVGMVADRAHRKGLEIAVLVEQDVPQVLRGDSGRLRQVLLNIVGNAVKFTDAGEVVLSVARQGETPTHIGLVFTVRDTGIGIPDSVKPRLFSPFTQADGSLTRKYGGTGLGLAISRQLVEMMGGSISLESAPGAGSTFTFIVWLRRPAMSTLPPDPPLAEVSGVRVLVVDDNATNRRIVRHYAESWGMQVTEACDAIEALHSMRTSAAAGAPFGLAVIDAQMPIMDGYALARSIHTDDAIAAARVVMLSSLITQPGRGELAGMGILQVLTKPVRKRQLHECVARALSDQAAPHAAKLAGTRPAVESLGKGRILVVEDNLVNQKVTMLMLAKLGYSGQVAGNGREALRAMAHIPYDAILMDCQMPEMDGFQATREIRRAETNCRIPIIAMTAGAMQGDQEKCLAAGMDDYVAKPFYQATLSDVLRRWLTRRNVGA